MSLDKLFNPEKYKDKEKKKKRKQKPKIPAKLKSFWKGVKKVMENVKIFTKEEDEVILSYLDKQIGRTDETISDLRERISNAPDDEYSKEKLHNQFYLRDELLAMKRRIKIKE